MKPEEFTVQLRDRIQRDLPNVVEFARETTTITEEGKNFPVVDQHKVDQLTNDPKPSIQMCRAGLMDPRDSSLVNSLFHAILRSETVNAYMREAGARYSKSPRVMKILGKYVTQPSSVNPDEIRHVLDELVNDDYLLTGPIKVLFEDIEIRNVLRLPKELTFEDYVRDLRKAIHDAESLDEIFEAAHPGGDLAAPFACNFTVCAWYAVTVYVTVAAAVHTVAAAVNYAVEALVVWTELVFTVSGPMPGTPQHPFSKLGTPVTSKCNNQTSTPIWVAFPTSTSFKRMALPPGLSTATLGIAAPAAVLIGGPGNPLTSLLLESGKRVTSGHVALGIGTPDRICEVTLKSTGTEVGLEINEAQQEEQDVHRAGWRDFEQWIAKPGTAPAPLGMTTTAAAVPAGFDIEELMTSTFEAERYYDALRFEALIRGWKQ